MFFASVLLCSDGGYAAKSWPEMIASGIAADKEKQKGSLAWICEQSLNPLCVKSLANHGIALPATTDMPNSTSSHMDKPLHIT